MPLLKIVVPADAAEFQDLARRLLDAAGDRPERIRTITSTPHLAFEVDEELLEAIGYFDAPASLPPAEDPADPVDEQPEDGEASRPSSRKSGKKPIPAPPSGDVTETENP